MVPVIRGIPINRKKFICFSLFSERPCSNSDKVNDNESSKSKRAHNSLKMIKIYYYLLFIIIKGFYTQKCKYLRKFFKMYRLFASSSEVSFMGIVSMTVSISIGVTTDSINIWVLILLSSFLIFSLMFLPWDMKGVKANRPPIL